MNSYKFAIWFLLSSAIATQKKQQQQKNPSSYHNLFSAVV